MHRTFLAALATTALATTAAHAGVINLNFEGLASSYPYSPVAVGEFYDGGVSGDGIAGPNYGVAFSSNALALCLNSLTVDCSNTSRGGLAPSSAEGGLIFLTGTSTTMDVAAGFSTGFSFNYAEPNTVGGSVSVYDGLDGTGNLLASFDLSLTPSNCPGYNAAYCPFVPIGVAFAGTAESVVFGGVANYVVFDDITFGSSTPGIPEPATWATMLAGLAGAGAMLRRRRSLAAA